MTVHGKHMKRKRGAHKNAASPETLRWNREHLQDGAQVVQMVSRAPDRPSWMSVETYAALLRLRGEL